MKPFRVWIAFFALFTLFFAFIFTQKTKIDTDFFSLVQDSGVKENSHIFQNLKERLSKEIVILVDDKNVSKSIIHKAKTFNLFSNITYGANKNFKHLYGDLNSTKLALLDRQLLKILRENPTLFFKNSIKELFSSFSKRTLSIKDDFFNFTKDYGSKNPTKVFLDIEDGRLKVKDKNKTFLFINVTLKNGYNQSRLLEFIKDIQHITKTNNSHLLVSGGAIYSSVGRQTGQSQGVYMSVMSLTLTALLLWFAFKSVRVFSLVLVAIFGLSFGFVGSFLFFEKVHILAVVLSTSLIGLMYDFAIHWLSFNVKNQTVLPIKKMIKIFLLGFFITASGYGIFLFAPFELLNQVAIFSIFALCGAYMSTYFLLPTIFQNHKFVANEKAVRVLGGYENFLEKIYPIFGIKSFVVLVFILLGFYTFYPLKFNDNIKDYASTPPFWIDQAKKISKLTNAQDSTNFLITKGKNSIKKQRDFLEDVKEKKLISSYDGIDKYFLSLKEQNDIKALFKKYKNQDDILLLFEKVGLDKNIVKKEFDNIINAKSLPLHSIVSKKSFQNFAQFLPDKNTSIVYLNGVKSEKKLQELAKKSAIVYADFTQSLSKSFQMLKILALKLKLFGYGIAFLLLAYFFGIKRSSLMLSLVLVSTLLALCFLALFGYVINIFAIYGLILASAVGIDYMIFAQNSEQNLTQKLFGITLASLTTFISFFILSFSNTPAVSVFGVSVSLCVIFCAFFASLLALKSQK